MSISQAIDGIEERQDLTIVLEETDDGLVEPCQFLVGLIAPGIVGTATVEHVAASVAAFILRDALAIGETVDLDHQRSLCIVLREGGRAVGRMGLIGVEVGGLVAISTTGHGIYLLELG